MPPKSATGAAPRRSAKTKHVSPAADSLDDEAKKFVVAKLALKRRTEEATEKNAAESANKISKQQQTQDAVGVESKSKEDPVQNDAKRAKKDVSINAAKPPAVAPVNAAPSTTSSNNSAFPSPLSRTMSALPPAPPQQQQAGAASPSNQALQQPKALQPLDQQTLLTINERQRNEIAQLQTELEHCERMQRMNMGRAPTLPNRACQAEVTFFIAEYDKIREYWRTQIMKSNPSHPKYWFWETSFHLATEFVRLARESFSYRGFQV